jgi:hypothetical protein
VLAGAVLAGALPCAAETLVVAVGAADGLADVPQAATSAAMLVSAAAASARRAVQGTDVIAVSFCAGGGGSGSRVTDMTSARHPWLARAGTGKVTVLLADGRWPTAAGR